MIKIIDFTELNKDKIISDQSLLGFALTEEQNHQDGKHLVFDDGVDIETEIEDIKRRLLTLEATRMTP